MKFEMAAELYGMSGRRRNDGDIMEIVLVLPASNESAKAMFALVGHAVQVDYRIGELEVGTAFAEIKTVGGSEKTSGAIAKVKLIHRIDAEINSKLLGFLGNELWIEIDSEAGQYTLFPENFEDEEEEEYDEPELELM